MYTKEFKGLDRPMLKLDLNKEFWRLPRTSPTSHLYTSVLVPKKGNYGPDPWARPYAIGAPQISRALKVASIGLSFGLKVHLKTTLKNKLKMYTGRYWELVIIVVAFFHLSFNLIFQIDQKFTNQPWHYKEQSDV